MEVRWSRWSDKLVGQVEDKLLISAEKQDKLVIHPPVLLASRE